MAGTLYGPNVASNKQKLQRLQDIISLALGAAAGIVGLESLHGFLFFLVGITLTNATFYLVCCQGDAGAFFAAPYREIFVEGLSSSLAGYVMTWCLLFALVK